MSTRKARVSLDGTPVGVLEERDPGSVFVYDAEWLERPDAVPISLTMPLTPTPYSSRGLLPFFENLLPEGWLLDLSTMSLKISKDDAFGLLLALCPDCVGAVEITPLES